MAPQHQHKRRTCFRVALSPVLLLASALVPRSASALPFWAPTLDHCPADILALSCQAVEEDDGYPGAFSRANPDSPASFRSEPVPSLQGCCLRCLQDPSCSFYSLEIGPEGGVCVLHQGSCPTRQAPSLNGPVLETSTTQTVFRRPPVPIRVCSGTQFQGRYSCPAPRARGREVSSTPGWVPGAFSPARQINPAFLRQRKDVTARQCCEMAGEQAMDDADVAIAVGPSRGAVWVTWVARSRSSVKGTCYLFTGQQCPATAGGLPTMGLFQPGKALAASFHVGIRSDAAYSTN